MLNQVAHINLEIIFAKCFSTHINICTNIKVQRHTRCLHFKDVYHKLRGLPGGSVSKESACSAGDQAPSLGREDPLEKEKATHSSILA